MRMKFMRTMWLKLTKKNKINKNNVTKKKKKNKKLQMAYSKLKKKIFFLKIK